MARSENIAHAHILHVHWDANCLVLHFVKSKATRWGGTVIKSGGVVQAWVGHYITSITLP
jgi:hypothetical protein